MNRRYILIALAIVVPLALLVPSKIAASWRPAKVAVLSQTGVPTLVGLGAVSALRATPREVVLFSFESQNDTICDLQTQRVRPTKNEDVTADGSALWRLKGGNAPQLLVRSDATIERAYALSAEDAEELNAMMEEGFYTQSYSVTANAERVELAVGAHYYRWNTGSRVLERNTNCDMESSLENKAITRDGANIINAGLGQISALSTESGEFTRHTKVPKTNAEGAQISAFGTYSIYSPPISNAMKWRVLATADAHELWQFQISARDDVVTLSPDEKWLAIARGDRKIWEVRELPTGKIIRTLPLVPATNMGAFSPDGTTLYSVADGVLYRQRAR